MALSQNFPAYILCGGRSSRFGTDKARVLFDTHPQLLKLSGSLRAAGHSVHYVADRADRYSDLDVTCLVDQQPDCGPIAGLSRALRHRAEQLACAEQIACADRSECGVQNAPAEDRPPASGWLLLVNCDQVRWDPHWFAELSAATLARPASIAAAYKDTAWQPLPALFHIDALNEVDQRLREGRLSLQQLLDELDARGRCAKVVTVVSPSSWSFNTPEELDKLPKR